MNPVVDGLRESARRYAENQMPLTGLAMAMAADEIDALQAKLDRVRALCADTNFQFVSTLAREVLAAIEKETNDG